MMCVCVCVLPPTLVALAGVDFVEMPVLLWRWEVFNRVEVELGFKII